MSARSYPFPVLEKLENSGTQRVARPPYQPSAGYYFAEAEFDGGDTNATIMMTHHLSGNNLVVDLLEQGKAIFAITVSAPDTMFRRIIVEDQAMSLLDGDEFVLRQPVVLKKADFTGTVYVRGSVIVTQKVAVEVESGHGLMPALVGSRFSMPQGTVIATEAMHAFGIGTLSALFKLRVNKKLADGQIKVEPVDADGYRFIVHAGTRLFQQMSRANGPAEKAHTRSICTHALSRGLEILRAYSEDDSEWWKSFPNLRWLEGQIEDLSCPRWDQDDFCAEVVATALRDHNIVKTSAQD